MTNKRLFSFLLALVLLCACLPALAERAADAQIVALRTQGRENPLGIDAEQPAFSWQMRSDAVGAAQTAYRVTVWDALENVVWDSGVVESGESHEVLYEGEALKPSTTYTWQVAVTDQTGATVESEKARFVTALMDDSLDAWDGAKWIGAPSLPLDARSKSVFHISADVTLAEGANAASFILGADDYRLQHRSFNPRLLEGENYVRVEWDLSGLTAAGGAKLNVYRVGYDPADALDAPFATVGESEDLDAVLTEANKYDSHHVDIFCTASTLTFTVDGVTVNPTPVTVAEMGNSYPHLNGVGFAMNAGETATFENYRITSL